MSTKNILFFLIFLTAVAIAGCSGVATGQSTGENVYGVVYRSPT